MMNIQCNADLRKDDFMATKTLTTRISLKTDTTANWAASTLVLLKGEQAIEIPESGEYKIKIGDGVKTFKDLPYVAMTPTEIAKLISDSAVQTVSLASGTNNGTVKLTVDGTVTDNIAVKGLGSAAYTNSNAYAAAGHGHSISGVSGLQAALDSKSAIGHTHDDRYYTESEMNTKLAGKANSSHTHGSGDITFLDASKLTGTISIDRLPAGALERCMIVADDAARLKLTTKDVQKGDTVKVTATGKMYFVIDDSKLSTEDGYTVYTAGTATSVPWSGVTGKPSTFTPSAHRHVKTDITDFPTSMPASDVYAWAKASTKPTYTKGEVGLGNVDNTADANKSVKYATSAGIANSASSVDWSGVQNKPSTFTPSAHTHTIANITGLQNALNGKANSSHTHSIDNVTGLQSALDGKASSGHTHSLFSGEIHFSTGTYKDPTDGISTAIKASGGIAADVFYEGTTKLSDKYQPKGSYAAASHTHTIAQITNLQSTLDGKSNNGHTHNYAGSGSAGGSANSAVKLDSSAGSATQPIYFSGGKPTACSYTINASVPSGAKFTDTNTWRGIQNNLSSDSTTDSLSAAQGKRLKELVDGKTDIHNLNYGIKFSSSSMDSNASQNTLYPAKYENGAYSKSTGVSTYANRNNTIHIGTSSNMFGDIYLAGGITSLGVYNVTTTTNLPVSVTSQGYLRRYKSGSSLMIKNHIYKIGYDEAKELLNTNVYSFRYNDDGQPANGKEHAAIDRYGFVLEDMEKTFPMAVEYDEDGLPAAWCVQIIVPTILEIVKHQQAEISSLKAENEELKEKISEIDELKKSLDELRVLITDK